MRMHMHAHTNYTQLQRRETLQQSISKSEQDTGVTVVEDIVTTPDTVVICGQAGDGLVRVPAKLIVSQRYACPLDVQLGYPAITIHISRIRRTTSMHTHKDLGRNTTMILSSPLQVEETHLNTLRLISLKKASIAIHPYEYSR
jgi:hypothetical protein